MKTRVFVTAGVVAVLATAGLAYALRQDGGSGEAAASATNTPQTSAAPAEGNSAAIRFPSSWTRKPAETGDEKAGVLMRLERSQPQASFLLRRIFGKIEVPLNAGKLEEETEKALHDQVPGFVLVEKGTQKRGDQEIVRIDYIQGKDQSSFRALLLLVPTSDRSFYLTFRASSNDHANVAADYDQIVDGFFEWQQAVSDQK